MLNETGHQNGLEKTKPRGEKYINSPWKAEEGKQTDKQESLSQ